MPRPPLPDDEFRTNRTVRMSEEEWERIGRRAASEGVSIGDLIRSIVLAEVDRRDRRDKARAEKGGLPPKRKRP